MEQNKIFSIQRFFWLIRQNWYINGKSFLLFLGGLSGALIFYLLFIHLFTGAYHHWNSENYIVTILFFFIAGGVLYSSLAFPGFRSKEKRYNYLMLPASITEKYVFEFLGRIILYILIVPWLLWLITHVELGILRKYIEGINDIEISYITFFREHLEHRNLHGGITITTCLLFFTFPFATATYFKKNPTIKMLFALLVIIISFFVLAIVTKLFIGTNITFERVLFINDKKSSIAFLFSTLALANVVLLAISYFNLKEKEA